MKLAPLLAEHPRWLQVLIALVLPALYGAVTGYFLGVSEPAYLVLSIVGIVGAVGAVLVAAVSVVVAYSQVRGYA